MFYHNKFVFWKNGLSIENQGGPVRFLPWSDKYRGNQNINIGYLNTNFNFFYLRYYFSRIKTLSMLLFSLESYSLHLRSFFSMRKALYRRMLHESKMVQLISWLWWEIMVKMSDELETPKFFFWYRMQLMHPSIGEIMLSKPIPYRTFNF